MDSWQKSFTLTAYRMLQVTCKTSAITADAVTSLAEEHPHLVEESELCETHFFLLHDLPSNRSAQDMIGKLGATKSVPFRERVDVWLLLAADLIVRSLLKSDLRLMTVRSEAGIILLLPDAQQGESNSTVHSDLVPIAGVGVTVAPSTALSQATDAQSPTISVHLTPVLIRYIPMQLPLTERQRQRYDNNQLVMMDSGCESVLGCFAAPPPSDVFDAPIEVNLHAFALPDLHPVILQSVSRRAPEVCFETEKIFFPESDSEENATERARQQFNLMKSFFGSHFYSLLDDAAAHTDAWCTVTRESSASEAETTEVQSRSARLATHLLPSSLLWRTFQISSGSNVPPASQAPCFRACRECLEQLQHLLPSPENEGGNGAIHPLLLSALELRGVPPLTCTDNEQPLSIATTTVAPAVVTSPAVAVASSKNVEHLTVKRKKLQARKESHTTKLPHARLG